MNATVGTGEPRISPSTVAAEAVAALAELLDRLVKNEPITTYAVADLPWTPIDDGGWDRLGLQEADGGFGLSLRDLIEVSTLLGRYAAPLPLSSTLALAAPGSSGPVTAAVPRRRSRSSEARVPFGAFPGIRITGRPDIPGDRVPDDFAPTLRVVRLPWPGGELGATAAHRVSVLWSAEALGAARVLHSDVVEYARRRIQFGNPIGGFQAVKHMLADAALALSEATTALVMASAEPASAAGALRWALGRCVLVSEIVTQVYGGIGLTWELGTHLRTRHILMIRDLVEDLSVATDRTGDC